MKKTCKTVGSDGKENGLALRPTKFSKALTEYLATKGDEAWCFAYGLCRDRDEAGELVQEACYRALKASGNYDAPRSVKSWLFTILRNAFMDSRRRYERRKGCSMNGQMGATDQDWTATLADGEESAQTYMERTEEAEAVRAAMRRLPKKYREVLRLCDIKRMRYEDATKKLGIPSGTVRSRLLRARAALRRDPAIRRLS